MDIPIYSKYYKKLDAFIEISKLDRIFNEQLKDYQPGKSECPSWEAEKKILFWISKGHKKLGSRIKKEYIQDNAESKLKDFRLENNEVDRIDQAKLLNNLVERGFAEGGITDGIKFNQNAYLYSEVLNEIFYLGDANDEYKNKVLGTRQLSRGLRYYLKYQLSILMVWYIFFLIFLGVSLGLLNLLGVLDSVKVQFNFISWWVVFVILLIVPTFLILTIASFEIKEMYGS